MGHLQSTENNLCFVIGPIGEEGSPERRGADAVFNDIIEPVLDRAGYKSERPHNIANPGNIFSQIMEQLVGSALVIADLTGANPNVYFELAIRYATGKPVLQLLKKGERLPSDIQQNRTIFYDLETDIARKKSRDELQNFMKSVRLNPDAYSDNFVVQKVNLIESAKRSRSPEENQLVNIERIVRDISSSLEVIKQASIENRLTDLDKKINSVHSSLQNDIRKKSISENNLNRLLERMNSLDNRISDFSDILTTSDEGSIVGSQITQPLKRMSNTETEDCFRQLVGLLRQLKEKETSSNTWFSVNKLVESWNNLSSEDKRSSAGSFREDLRRILQRESTQNKDEMIILDCYDTPEELFVDIAKAMKLLKI